MKGLPLQTIIENTEGKLLRGPSDFIVDDFSTRIRRTGNGSILFDLYHDHTEKDITVGNLAIVTDQPENFDKYKEATIIQVPNIGRAYWKFIDFYRSQFNIPVVGITGTCGKTTTKEMIKHILSKYYNVKATYKSYNADFRHLGYLLDIDDKTEAGVYEMGVASRGDLKSACRYFKPQIGVITTIGIDHLQSFDSIDSYIQAKAEILEGLDNKGTLILNKDNENIKKIDLSNYKGKILYFGYDLDSDYRISNLKHVPRGLKFKIRHAKNSYDVFIPLFAEFNAYNASAAVAAAAAMGIDIKEACEHMASFKNVEKHFEFKKGVNGCTVIDDTWSTNPTSAEAAVKLLKYYADGKKSIVVLGKMSLLGSESKKYHQNLGKKVAELGINKLFLIGGGSEEIGNGAIQRGMNKNNVIYFKDLEESFNILKKYLDKNAVVLVKTTMMESYGDFLNKLILNS